MGNRPEIAQDAAGVPYAYLDRILGLKTSAVIEIVTFEKEAPNRVIGGKAMFFSLTMKHIENSTVQFSRTQRLAIGG